VNRQKEQLFLSLFPIRTSRPGVLQRESSKEGFEVEISKFLCIVPHKYRDMSMEMTTGIKDILQYMKKLSLDKLKKIDIILEVKNCA
jgi:hypothetical protein